MFGGSNRRYTPVNRYDAETGGRGGPRSGSGGRRAGGASWKKYAVLGGVAIALLLFVASGRGRVLTGSTSDELQYDEVTRPELEGSWPASKEDVSYPHKPVKGGSSSTKPISNIDFEDEEDEPSAQKEGEGVHEKHPLIPPKAGANKPTKPSKPTVETPEVDAPKKESTSYEVAVPKGPTSFETDPDPLGTTYCKKAFKGKKLVQYALMIDAGSTGSRIHVYKFNYCNASPMLEYETFKSIQPGLSSFKDSPTEAAGSLNPLIDEALRVVPESLQKCSPLAVKATAGLRLLGAKQSNAILAEVEHHLKSDFPFPLIPTDPVVIMDGKDEGVYAWITANYLLGKIGEGSDATDTLAVMDLGGASTQIVFEPTFKNESAFAEGDHKYELMFGGQTFTLYQHSYLGYGLMRARRSVHNLVAFTYSFGKEDTLWEDMSESTKIVSPCLGAGRSKKVTLDPPGRSPVNVTMVGGSGGYESCKRVVELVMAKDAICEVKPCSFNGVYQPSLLDTFPKGSFLALSYFYDRIRPLFAPDEAETKAFDLGYVKQLAQTACSSEAVWQKKFAGNKGALAELEERSEYCLDLTFMHALLGLGYEIESDRDIIVGKQLRGVELGWALGAGLAMLDGDLKCLV